MASTKFFKVGLLNAGSLGTGHDDFKVALEDSDIDILAVNETWISEGNDAKAPIVPGYRLRHSPRPKRMRNGRGGGVGFYFKNTLKPRVRSHPVSDIEQMWFTIKVKNIRLLIGTAYRPNWINPDTFFDSLTDTITSFHNYDYVVLLGDFNIDFLDSTDYKLLKLRQFLQYLNLKQITTEPTHFTDHSATLIDLICTDARVRNVDVSLIPTLSKHAFVFATFVIKKDKPVPRYITFRPIKNINLDNFNNDLCSVDWDSIATIPSVNDMIIAFNNAIINLFDMHAPEKRIVAKEKPSPWLTSNVRFMMKLRDKAHARFRISKKDAHKDYYKSLKKQVEIALINEKRAYFKHYIDANINDSKSLWKNLKNNVLLRDKPLNELSSHFSDPDLINSHFLNVPGEDRVCISDLTYFEYHKHPSVLTDFKLCLVSEEVVGKVLMSIKSNAKGHDGISMEMVLLTLPRTLPIITFIINESITTSTYPEAWKIAVVKPLPKKPNARDISDLRPISLLPCISKIEEKVVHQQLSAYLDKYKLLPDLQSGFRKGRSTATALLDVVDGMLSAQDRSMGTVLTLLDFSRAFDSINLPLLISKLSYYGFHISTINWFNSYLARRSQFVQLSGNDGATVNSSILHLNRGVPQGSILGPLLFILYTADISEHIHHCQYHLYADDVQLYKSFLPEDTDREVALINQDLASLAAWSKRNCLVLNPSKSKYMVCGSRLQTDGILSRHPNVKILDSQVDRVTEARNLGLIFDAALKFESHILDVAKKCFYRLHLLYRIRPQLSDALRIVLCEALVLSKVNYCDTVYGPCLLVRTQRILQRVQNACARFCFNVPKRSHITHF